MSTTHTVIIASIDNSNFATKKIIYPNIIASYKILSSYYTLFKRLVNLF